MKDKGSRNDGILVIASFEDQATTLGNGLAFQERAGGRSRSVNEGIRPLADFEDEARPLDNTRGGTLTLLNSLLTQHAEEVHELVSDLQSIIERLRQENAGLKAQLADSEEVSGRYHSDGPSEDEI